MNTNPPNNEGAIHESVQDYLDLLLTQATEKPEAQISLLSEREEWPLTRSASVTSLSRAAGGSRQTAIVTDPVVQPFLNRIERRGLQALPFAELLKPLPLKLSPRPIVSEQQTPKVPAVEAAVEVIGEYQQPEELKLKQPAPVVDVESTDGSEPSNPSETEAATQHFQTTQWLNGRPSWAQKRFECLLFSVGGLTLAVPLVELGAIHPINDEITPIFGQIDWFMGLLTVKAGNIKTVNTPKVVMPERYHELMKEQFNYVISINGVDWGLAVDNVSNAIILEPEHVRWRTERGKRPWLAGTVIEHMCALLDVSQLTAMFVANSR